MVCGQFLAAYRLGEHAMSTSSGPLSSPVPQPEVRHYRITASLQYDVECEGDPRDHPLLEHIADLVMELPNGFVSSCSEPLDQ